MKIDLIVDLYFVYFPVLSCVNEPTFKSHRVEGDLTSWIWFKLHRKHPSINEILQIIIVDLEVGCCSGFLGLKFNPHWKHCFNSLDSNRTEAI